MSSIDHPPFVECCHLGEISRMPTPESIGLRNTLLQLGLHHRCRVHEHQSSYAEPKRVSSLRLLTWLYSSILSMMSSFYWKERTRWAVACYFAYRVPAIGVPFKNKSNRRSSEPGRLARSAQCKYSRQRGKVGQSSPLCAVDDRRLCPHCNTRKRPSTTPFRSDDHH
jgi:hypothetical protein